MASPKLVDSSASKAEAVKSCPLSGIAFGMIPRPIPGMVSKQGAQLVDVEMAIRAAPCGGAECAFWADPAAENPADGSLYVQQGGCIVRAVLTTYLQRSYRPD
jgi:hypothetical protein